VRILYCNKYSFPFSGTERYLFELMDLMRSRGHETALFSVAREGKRHPYDQHFVPQFDFKNGNLWHAAKAGMRAIYSWQARRCLRRMIREFKPDVAHVRNIYHHISPSILWELKAHGIPVIYHLNDFKLLCPSYNMVAHGNACEKCSEGSFWHVMTEGCYAGRRGASLVLAAEAYTHKWLGTYQNCVDQFIAPSQFVKQKLVEHGWNESKIEVLHHFQKLPGQLGEPAKDSHVLYFGRLSPEKGIADLLEAMQYLPNVKLLIAGEGPQRDELQLRKQRLQFNNVEFLGHLQGEALQHAISSSLFTVLPSRAYETFGKSIVESYASARAVIASDLGSRRELVRDGETGLLYPVGNAKKLAEAIGCLTSYPDLAREMGMAGRELVRSRYTPEGHYSNLLFLYERLKKCPPDPIRSEAPATCSLATRPLKIAFIGGRGVISKYSGIETYYEEVGKRLVELGHEMTIYCRTYFTPDVTTHQRMRIVRLPTIRTKHLETLVHTFLSTVHSMCSGYDIVHFHALGPALFSFLPRLAGKKTVVTVQGLDWQRKKWGRIASYVLRLGEKAAIAFPDKTIVVSRMLKDAYSSRHGRDTHYIPNGAVIRKGGSSSRLNKWGLQSGQYILFLGRFSPEKNCHLLIEAYERIETRVKLVMAGGASHSDAYIAELRAHSSENISLLDWVAGADLDELLLNATLFVLPSDLEGMSLALLDAMGAGICVLASDVPENREVVGDAGFTFVHGSVCDLERMIRFAIDNPVLRTAKAKLARRRITESYTWPLVAHAMETVYTGLITPTKRPPTMLPSPIKVGKKAA
jgi:glycosyltransferase involved in cell wall biosynthesis